MNNKLIFEKNGIQYDASASIDGLSVIEFSREQTDNKEVSFSVSQELTFFAEAYDYLLSNGFWDCENGINCDLYCEGTLHLCGCDFTIPFRLSQKDTKWCPSDCSIIGSIEIQSNQNDCYECLSKPLIEYLYDPFTADYLNGFTPLYLQTQSETTGGGLLPLNGSKIAVLLDFAVKECDGLTGWCSSILQNGIYADLAIFFTATPNTFFPAPSYNLELISNDSILDVLNKLGGECGVFKDYQVNIQDTSEGCKLFFEHKDFFSVNGDFFTSDEFIFDEENSICFQLIESDECTSNRYSYTEAKPSRTGENSIDSLATNQLEVISFLPDGTLGKNRCECEPYKWSKWYFNDNGNLLWEGTTDTETLVVFDNETNTAIYDPVAGYNYPLNLNEQQVQPELIQTFINPNKSSINCEVEIADTLQVCPRDWCAFLRKLLNNNGFYLETQCGIVKALNVSIATESKTITLDNFEI